VKLVIMPGYAELIIKVDPPEEVTREGLLNLMMPWLYGPWPEAKQTGIINTDVSGTTLKDLLIEITSRYRQAGIEFLPYDTNGNTVDFDYDVLVNGRDYISLPSGLDEVLAKGDEIRIKTVTVLS